MSNLGYDTYTVNEMKQILNIGSNSAYALIHSGAFPVKKIGHSYRIPKEPFHAWLNACGEAAVKI